jgi:hypothetical protein
MTNSRKKIPVNTEADVMFYSDRQCCIDKNKGVHIHHVDGNPANNAFNNLALLCFECHDEASKTGSLSKKLSPHTIVKYRDHHYEVIKQRRNSEIIKLTKKSANPTYIDTLNTAIQASVIVEIAKIKAEYFQCVKLDRNDILLKFYAFKEYNFPRVCAELFEFLNRVAYETRSGLPFEMINTITSLVENYFPPEEDKITKVQIEKVGKLTLQIAFGIIYDTSIHSQRFHSMKQGYDLLKFIYVTSNNLKNGNLKKDVETTLNDIEKNLNRPERDDLGLAKSMFNIYKESLNNDSIGYPELGPELRAKVLSE